MAGVCSGAREYIVVSTRGAGVGVKREVVAFSRGRGRGRDRGKGRDGGSAGGAQLQRC